MKRLHEAGLTRLHLGFETGDDWLLKFINKGATAEEMIKAGRMVVESGIHLSEYVILGLGGVERSEVHSKNKTKVKFNIVELYSILNVFERCIFLSSKKELKPAIALYPTPVVLATSVDEKGKPNVCTLAWAGVLCSEPPQIGISIRPSRYSHELIIKTKEYVVNIPTADIVKETDYCGMVTGKKVDKFKETKLTPVKAKKVKPPLIKECPVNLECKVKDIIKLGAHDLFIGEIVNINADADVMDSPTNINFGKLKAITWNPISREYYGLGESLGEYGFSQKKQ